VTKSLDSGARGHGGGGNAQIDVQACDIVTQTIQLKDQGQGVLAAGEGDQDAVLKSEQLLPADALFYLAGEKIKKTGGAEAGVVAGQGHNGGVLATGAFHGCSLQDAGQKGKADVSRVKRAKHLDFFLFHLDHILTKAREVTNADTGAIFLAEGNELVFAYTRNDSLLAADEAYKYAYATILPVTGK